ncbi:MAG: hypothetical protein D6811_05415, partial [Alphaproteobacteria bacterium]
NETTVTTVTTAPSALLATIGALRRPFTPSRSARPPLEAHTAAGKTAAITAMGNGLTARTVNSVASVAF